ncbi:MAG: F-box protein, partial [Parachlamydiaceae bacterium]
MQLWPLDILGEVFKNIPKEAPIIAKVCKRFRNAVDTEAFWALRLKTRFNIKVIPQGTYKSYYKLCFAGMEKLKSPIIPSDQIAEGSFKRYQNGAVSRIAHRIDENLSIELDNNAVRLKKGHEVLALFVLAP